MPLTLIELSSARLRQSPRTWSVYLSTTWRVLTPKLRPRTVWDNLFISIPGEVSSRAHVYVKERLAAFTQATGVKGTVGDEFVRKLNRQAGKLRLQVNLHKEFHPEYPPRWFPNWLTAKRVSRT